MIKNRLFVTGGSGFVGGHIITRAKTKWDVFTAYNTRPAVPSMIKSFQINLASEKSIDNLIEKIQPEVVIHSAAWPDLEKCEKNPRDAFHINATSSEILAELSERFEFRLIFISTDMVFDGNKGNYSETSRTNPINIYGKTKLSAEKYIRAASTNYVIARSALIYGPPVYGSNSFSERILKKVTLGKTIPLFKDQYRSPILVQNLADALLELAQNDFTGILHLGGAERTDRYTFGMQLAEIKGFSQDLLKPVSMHELKTKAPRPEDSSFDISKAEHLLKTRLLGFKEGLKLI